MTVNTRTTSPEAALAFAHSQFTNDSSVWYRRCLAFVSDCWGQHYYPTAYEAWLGAKQKHQWDGDESKIPLGAACFSKGSDPAGHVWIAGRKNASGRRIMWSNDVKQAGHIDPVQIEFFHDHWGHTILGWTGDLNGYDLPLGSAPSGPLPPTGRTVSLAAVDKAARNDPGRSQGGVTTGAKDDVLIVEHALVSLGFLSASLADGSYGSSTIDAYKRWQRMCGFTGADANGIPGKTSLTRLGNRFGFKVS